LTSNAGCDIKFKGQNTQLALRSKQEETTMKVKIPQKDIVSYLFLLVLAAVCMVIGVRVLFNHHIVSGTFSLVLGVLLIAASTSLVLRKE